MAKTVAPARVESQWTRLVVRTPSRAASRTSSATMMPRPGGGFPHGATGAVELLGGGTDEFGAALRSNPPETTPMFGKSTKSRFKIVPFLWYTKEAEEAAKFYASVFRNTQLGEEAVRIANDTEYWFASAVFSRN